jgi:hypothetical protein
VRGLQHAVPRRNPPPLLLEHLQGQSIPSQAQAAIRSTATTGRIGMMTTERERLIELAKMIHCRVSNHVDETHTIIQPMFAADDLAQQILNEYGIKPCTAEDHNAAPPS